MPLKLFKSADGRYKSDFYTLDGELVFSLAERTSHGVLISEFNSNGESVDQIYIKSSEPLKELGEHLKGISDELHVEEVAILPQVMGHAICDGCGGAEIVREFDLTDVRNVTDVPVVPIFVCTRCKKRFYSMGPKYLKKLVARNPELFDAKELDGKEKDEAAFMHEIQEYMVRIFASKKLAMMKIIK